MRSSRRPLSRLVGSLTAGAVVVSVAAFGPAQAARADDLAPGAPAVEQRPASAVTADNLPTVQIDSGVVWTQTIVGNTVFAGGSFSQTRPAGAARGQQLTARANLLAYDIRTGNLIGGFAPTVNGPVKVVRASPDGKRLYIGGTFTQVNGQARNNIAALNPSTGQLLPDFSGAIGGSYVNAIAVSGSYVYVGGLFSRANGAARTNLAAFDHKGTLRDWAPTADRQVDGMVLAPKGDRVIVSGRFGRVNNTTAIGTGSLNATTGAVMPWAINTVVKNGNANTGGTWGLSTDGKNIYGATWNTGGGNYEGTWAANPDTGAIVWLTDGRGDQYDVYSDGTTTYEVGHSHLLTSIGGWADYRTPAGNHQFAVALTTQPKGRSIGGGYYSFKGQPGPAVVNWTPLFYSGTATGMGQAGWTVTGNGDYVVIAGEFPAVNGDNQYGMTRFAKPALAPDKSGPREAGTTWGTPSFRAGPAGGTVSIRTTWDRDDINLTYQLMRSGTSTPVAVSTVPSIFWQRGTVTLTDDSAKPGQTYSYQVKVVDPNGNSQLSASVSGKAGACAAAGCPVPKILVVDDGDGGNPAAAGKQADLNVAVSAPGASREQFTATVASQNVEAKMDIAVNRLPTGGATMPQVVVRRTNAGDYRSKLIISPNGAVSVSLTKYTAAGGEGIIKSAVVPNLTYKANDALSVRLKATTANGVTTLSTKVWKANTAEPTAWNLTTTDSTAALQTTGKVGISVYLSGKSTNSPQNVTGRSFTVTTQ